MSSIPAREVRVYTDEFRIYGLMHVPARQSVDRMLNSDRRAHLALSRCIVYEAGVRHPPRPDELLHRTDFAAVPQGHVRWLVGGTDDAESTVERRAGTPVGGIYGGVGRGVYLLFADHVIAGELSVPPARRLSDHLQDVLQNRPFQTLTRVRVLAGGEQRRLEQLPELQSHAVVTVNLRAAGGIFDLGLGERSGRFTLEEDAPPAFRLEEG